MSENVAEEVNSIMLENENERNSKSIEFVKPGGCFLGDELIHCALEESECNGYRYYSHRELLLFNDKKAETAEHCLQIKENSLGMCTSPIDKLSCTSHPSNCVIDTKFVYRVPYCSIKYNHFPDRKFSHARYGRCVPNSNDLDGGTCVWSVDSCPHGLEKDTNTFTRIILDDYGDDPCTCDKVKIGACVHDVTGFASCAVSPDACDLESDFLSWQELQQKYNQGDIDFECRLCDRLDLASEVPIGFNNKLTNGGSTDFNFKSSSCANTGSEGTVMFFTGGILGGSFTLVVMVILYYAYGIYRQRKMNQEEEKGGRQPPETL